MNALISSLPPCPPSLLLSFPPSPGLHSIALQYPTPHIFCVSCRVSRTAYEPFSLPILSFRKSLHWASSQSPHIIHPKPPIPHFPFPVLPSPFSLRLPCSLAPTYPPIPLAQASGPRGLARGASSMARPGPALQALQALQDCMSLHGAIAGRHCRYRRYCSCNDI